MSTKTVTAYFKTTSASCNTSWMKGTTWNDYVNGTYPACANGQVNIVGAYAVPSQASNVTVNYDITITGDVTCGNINVVAIGTNGNMTNVFYQGGKCWSCLSSYGCKTQTSGSYSVEGVAGQVLLIQVIGTSSADAYTTIKLYGQIQYDIPVIEATVTQKILAPNGTPAANATVSWTDETSGATGQVNTNAEGVATITGVDVGDTLDVTVDYGSLSANETFQVTTAQQTVPAYQFTCSSGTQWDPSTMSCTNALEFSLSQVGKYILVAAGVIGGTAVAYEIAKSVSYHEEGVARFGK